MRYVKTTSRILESIIGIFGGILGLIASSFILFIGSFGFDTTAILGILALIGSFLGIFASIYVNYDNHLGGVMLIISAFLVVIGATLLGIPGMLFLLIAGILALFR
ncbi:hypothetical protein LJB96_03435 [Methanobrevibacter sp. OttesenSCG-928-K11]|nr:hypothetical protein [Methanobrevibacter sp. OttesenSCG-928-K11]MDL2270243.1 hypothetical protein [Methanobrevibacter sp. OttesenSCG-928-I08]